MPGLRENIENRLSPELIIDEEFASLIPPLTHDEFSGLEQSIIAEGCREAIIVWNGVIVDGHNRYRICRAHKIPYRTERRIFASRDEAILWMLRNQLSRRNLNDFQRVEMVRKCEEAVKAKAKERQGARNDLITSGQNFSEVAREEKRATDELGAMAGVSRKTYEHAAAVLDYAPEAVTDAVRRNELSINAGYEVTKMPHEEQIEIASLMEKGEKPSQAVSFVKKRRNNKLLWTLTVHLTAEEYEQVKTLAHTQNTSIGSMTAQLVREALTSHERKSV